MKRSWPVVLAILLGVGVLLLIIAMSAAPTYAIDPPLETAEAIIAQRTAWARGTRDAQAATRAAFEATDAAWRSQATATMSALNLQLTQAAATATVQAQATRQAYDATSTRQAGDLAATATQNAQGQAATATRQASDLALTGTADAIVMTRQAFQATATAVTRQNAEEQRQQVLGTVTDWAAIPVTAAVAWSLQPESKITRPSTL